MNNDRYEVGKNDIFSEVTILKHLLDKEDFGDFQKELARCFKKYSPNDVIVHEMGFPDNWKNVVRYKL